MKRAGIVFAVLLMAGCTGVGDLKLSKSEKLAVNEQIPIEKTVDELKELTGMEQYLSDKCGQLQLEYTLIRFSKEQHEPSLIGYCHPGGNANLEYEQGIAAVGFYDDEAGEWTIDEVMEVSTMHPFQSAGILQPGDGTAHAVLVNQRVAARFGGTDATIIGRDPDGTFSVEQVHSDYTQNGEVHVEGNAVLIEDEQVIERFVLEDNEFHVSRHLKNVKTTGDVVITYDREGNGPLSFNPPAGSLLDVKPGDTISLRRARPLALMDFGVHTTMEKAEGEVDTYIVKEADIGSELSVFEYNAPDAGRFTIGQPAKKREIRSASGEVFSPDYYASLKKGMVPGASVPMGATIGELKAKLGQPEDIAEVEGGLELIYDLTYGYSSGYGEDSDAITQIAHYFPDTGVSKEEVIKYMGEPDSISYAGVEGHEVTGLWYFTDEYWVYFTIGGMSLDDPILAASVLRKD